MIAQERRFAHGRGRRNQHADRLRQGAAVLREQLDRLIERGGIGAAFAQDGLALHRQLRVARGHAGAVAPYGIDLAVVRQHAQRLRAQPRGQRVRSVALMEDGEVGDVLRRLQVRIEVAEQAPDAHGLIDDGLRRERTDVGRRLVLRGPILLQTLELLARQVQPMLDGLRVAAGDQHLPQLGHGLNGDLAQGVHAHGDVAPRQHAYLPGVQAAGQALLRLLRISLVLFARGQVQNAHAERLFFGQDHAGGLQQERPRHGGRQAHAVGAFTVRGHGAAMRQTGQRGQRLLQYLMGGLGLRGGDKTDATGVVVVAGIEQRNAWLRGCGDTAALSTGK